MGMKGFSEEWFDCNYKNRPPDLSKTILAPKKEVKKSKYSNIKTVVDGITFDSKREAAFYGKLNIAKKAGEITDIQRQVPYQLTVNGSPICKYYADFVVTYANGKTEVFDVKGMKTQTYRLKYKLMFAIHGIIITEVK